MLWRNQTIFNFVEGYAIKLPSTVSYKDVVKLAECGEIRVKHACPSDKVCLAHTAMIILIPHCKDQHCTALVSHLVCVSVVRCQRVLEEDCSGSGVQPGSGNYPAGRDSVHQDIHQRPHHQCLLHRGSVFQRDHGGWTSLHGTCLFASN